MNIVFPDNTTEVIDKIREAIGRDISIIVETLSGCSQCGLDVITNGSTNPFCTVCSGLYWIPVVSSYVVKAHVTWGKINDLNWATGGKYFGGDCLVQIKYGEDVERTLKESKYIVVDNKKMEIDEIKYGGVPKINRILIYLKEIVENV